VFQFVDYKKEKPPISNIVFHLEEHGIDVIRN